MNRYFLVIFFVLVGGFCGAVRAESGAKRLEKSYADEWCNSMGGSRHRLEDGTEVDCLTDEVAYEVDFGRKWAEGLGQAMFYAAMTNRRAGVVLILHNEKERRFAWRVRLAAGYYGVQLEVKIIKDYDDLK